MAGRLFLFEPGTLSRPARAEFEFYLPVCAGTIVSDKTRYEQIEVFLSYNPLMQ
jgi:hypothetical protein